MPLYKYMLLSNDIEGFMSKHHWATFTSRTIKEMINERKGFYRYSSGTLSKAIDYLILQNKVIAYRPNNHAPYVFAFIPVMKIDALKERNPNDIPF